MIKIDNYNQFLDLLLYQYTDSTNLRGIITGFLENADDIETALFEIQDEFYLADAVGAQLDILGIIFGVSRNGLFDALYRKAIQEKAILRYSGEPETIIELMQSIYGATYVQYRLCTTPGKYYLYTDISWVLASQLNPISPTGVQGFFEKPIVTGSGAFLVDATGHLICSVVEIETLYLVDALGVPLVDAQNRNIVTTQML